MQSNQRDSSESIRGNPVSLAIERSKVTGEEFCNLCGKGMQFPLATHIDHPIRYKDGARYTEGAGQTCPTCVAS